MVIMNSNRCLDCGRLIDDDIILCSECKRIDIKQKKQGKSKKNNRNGYSDHLENPYGYKIRGRSCTNRKGKLPFKHK